MKNAPLCAIAQASPSHQAQAPREQLYSLPVIGQDLSRIRRLLSSVTLLRFFLITYIFYMPLSLTSKIPGIGLRNCVTA
ncbi:hypothetical protein [Paratractidigestivibacter sp.]|uniref:hypothetical protein n=1 Tax=Paratractidigestivibacter sp. TaxID=2847316 RepID=UPI002ABD710D|nr:hypothetical protein [Paratractidigestivibacter sp.]